MLGPAPGKVVGKLECLARRLGRLPGQVRIGQIQAVETAGAVQDDGSWAADIGAYFAGRRLGRIKLAPALSPNKTWEGVLGGLLLSLLVAVAGLVWFDLPWLGFISLCLAAVLASVVGDLAESMFKRQRGLKDSSHLLPGHGGILDRIDSLSASFPLLALGLVWLGLVT